MFAAKSPPLALPSAPARTLNILAELLVLLCLLPLVAAAIESVGLSSGQSKYAHWWGTLRGWEALWKTMQLASLATLVAIGLAWVLVTLTVHCSRRWAFPVALLSCLPMPIPSSTLATTWIVLAGRQGPLGKVLAGVGLSVYSIPAATMILAMRYFGIAVGILMVYHLRSLACLPAERVFRISRFTTALRLRLQPAVRITAAAGLIVMLFCMNDHIIPGMLLITTYGPQIMIQYSALLDPAGAAALAVPIAGVGMGMVILALLLGRRCWSQTEKTHVEQNPPGSPAQRAIAAALIAIILVVVLGAPVVVLAQRAGSFSAMGQAVYQARRQAWQTLYCVAIASPICSVFAAVLAGRWVRCRQTGAFTAVPLVLLNLTIPATLLGIGGIELSQHWPLRMIRSSSWPLILAYVARFIPLATLFFFVIWRNDSAVRNPAAKVHGITPWRTMFYLTWPRRRASVLAVTVLCGLLIATELEMSILLAAPGEATLGIRLYTLIHTAPDSVVSALTLAILALVGPGIVLFMFLLARVQTQRGVRTQ